MNLKRGQNVRLALRAAEAGIGDPARYRTRTLPALGALIRDGDEPEKQLTLE